MLTAAPTTTSATTRSGAGDPRAVELVGGVRWVDVPGATDERGQLAFLQPGGGLPFTPSRVFYVYGVPVGTVRGEHAHRECEQLLVCVRGSIEVAVDDAHRRAKTVLDDPRRALHVPPMVWGTQRALSPDAVLLVLASHPYDAEDYISDHQEFVASAIYRLAAEGPR